MIGPWPSRLRSGGDTCMIHCHCSLNQALDQPSSSLAGRLDFLFQINKETFRCGSEDTSYTHAPRAPCRGGGGDGVWPFALLTRPGRPRPIRVRASDQLACVARPPARLQWSLAGEDWTKKKRVVSRRVSNHGSRSRGEWVGRLVDRRRRARSVYRKGKKIKISRRAGGRRAATSRGGINNCG